MKATTPVNTNWIAQGKISCSQACPPGPFYSTNMIFSIKKFFSVRYHGNSSYSAVAQPPSPHYRQEPDSDENGI